MTDTRQTLPAAGWYYDPGNHTQVRWWNGAAWTDNAVPVPHVDPVDPVDPVLPATSGASSRQSLAIGSEYEWDRESRFREAFDDEAPSAVLEEDASRRIPTRWFTASVFAVAVTPLVTLLALVGLLAVVFFSGELYTWRSIGPVLLPWLWGLVFAARDSRRLVTLKYRHPPRAEWALLGAPVYLLARTIATRRQARLGGGVLVIWLVSLVVSVALAGAGASVLATDYATAIVRQVEQEVAAELSTARVAYTVECPPVVEAGATPIVTGFSALARLAPGTTLTCAVTDTKKRAGVATVFIGADGSFTYTPPTMKRG